MEGPRHRAWRLAAIVVASIAFAERARADVAAQAQLGYGNQDATTTDPTGLATRSESQTFLQRYRLTLDERPLPLLTLGASGFYNWSLAWTRSHGIWSSSDSRQWNGVARLGVGGPLLSGGADYTRNEQSGSATTVAGTLSGPALIGERYSAFASWKPSDLPTLDLRYAHGASYDAERQGTDMTTNEVQLASRFQPDRRLDLRYNLRYGESTDHLRDVGTSEVDSAIGASWSDTFLARRVTYSLNYQAATRNSRVTANGPGGTVALQRFPTVGLSVVEAFPAVPTHVTLDTTPALVDGVTAGASASTGINLGWGRSFAGDVAYRDIGAQFADAVTPVNTIYVWVDKPLPAPVSEAFSWDVYASDNNLDWTLVRAAAPASFNPAQNRFEITITAGQAQARYLKAVVKPLPSSFASDPRLIDPGQFNEIFLTEIQFFLVQSAASVRGSHFEFAESFSGSVRVQLLRSPALSYDSSIFVAHAINPSHVTYSLANGLSLTHRFSPMLSSSARVERGDSDQGLGHESSNRWSGSLVAEFLPTLGAGLTYGGAFTEAATGSTTSTNSASAFARAELYTGVSISGNVGASLSRTSGGQENWSSSASASLSLVPNPVLTLNGGASYTRSTISGGGQPESRDWRAAFDASAAFSPLRALALTGSISRFIAAAGRPSTVASFTGGFSPFPGGDLLLRYGYAESIETTNDARTRSHGPTLRWNVRPGSFLDASYQLFDSRSMGGDISSRAFNANFVMSLL